MMKIKELYEKIRDGVIVSDIELQREIIYSTEKQRLVIDSILNSIPLPAFYLWRNADGKLEVLDGKQRIEAIKKYIQNDLQYENKIWRETDEKTQSRFNETELSVIICEGNDELKRKIFNRINTLGVPLSPFEVLNGLYYGEYLRGLTMYVTNDKDILKVFPKNTRGKNQMRILKFISVIYNKGNIHEYIEKVQQCSFSTDQRVISKYIKFIRDIFEKYDQLDILFELSLKYYKDISIWKEHKDDINIRIRRYLNSSDAKVTDKAKEMDNIIQAVVNGISVDDKRLFTMDDKRELLRDMEKQDGKYQCNHCKKWFLSEELQIDHIEAWSKGGRTVLSNAQLLCKACNQKKGNN